MGKKAKLKAIKRLGNKLPIINQETSELHWYKGAEILECGTIKEIDGRPINPEKMYRYRVPVMMIRNNQRMMKRAFLRNGIGGMQALLDSTLKIIESNK